MKPLGINHRPGILDSVQRYNAVQVAVNAAEVLCRYLFKPPVASVFPSYAKAMQMSRLAYTGPSVCPAQALPVVS